MYASWAEREKHLQQAKWERMRMLATITIQPHCRKKVTPTQLLTFPWEKKIPKNTVSRDIGRERFQKLLQKLKDAEDNDRRQPGTEVHDFPGD